MVWLKCCPRCNGDLCENDDLHGYYITCVQCGYYLSEVEEVVLKYASPTQAVEGDGKVPVSAKSI